MINPKFSGSSSSRFSVLFSALLLAGCTTVGPDYQRPAFDLPTTGGITEQKPGYSTEARVMHTATVDDAALRNWWKSFQDPVLDQLLGEAQAANQDLVLAAGRVEEARATLAVANADRYPAVDANFSAKRTRNTQNSDLVPPGFNVYRKDFQMGLNASWELDFWGKLSRADEAARARLLSQQASKGFVETSLYSNIAQNYFALRSYDAQLQLAESALGTRQENLRLQQKRLAAGSIGAVDLHQAEAEVAATEVTAAQAKQFVVLTESVLAVLLGRSPREIAAPVIPRGQSIDMLYAQLTVPANLPADLLDRRPDIVAAEQNLVGANADVGQAKAQYFPSVTLTSGVGYESNALKNLINPSSILWNLGAGLTQPIFRAGAIGALVSGAEARKTQAKAHYVQTVQNAFKDVHDSLVTMAANEQIYGATQRRTAALKDTLRLAGLRYDNGYTSYLDVLTAQRDLLQTQSSLIDVQRSHLSAAVNLYKAIGGGWENN
ncbi:MAG: efflux transporter outer membrane subunit, partial [Herminiimonas sp.]|nr:efflux transporter outer membrane subunit [Herminiimonas sp.]